jgi:UDP-N-acetylglucosamine transferase subunit ALG13
MIFLTVGSSLPFDRLVQAVDELVIPAKLGTVFAQTGACRYRPSNCEWVHELCKGDFDQRLADAQLIVSHAGVGTIASALALGKRVIVMPRRKVFGEAVNDHQVSTAERFSTAGHVLLANDAQQLPGCFATVATFSPKPRSAQPKAVAQYIAHFLEAMSA